MSSRSPCGRPARVPRRGRTSSRRASSRLISIRATTSVSGSLRGYALAATLVATASPLTRVDSRQPAPLTFSFTEVGARGRADRDHRVRRHETNRYLLETTGCGVAMLDYDNDGWLDLFFVNGTTLEGFPKGQEPTSHLYRNRATAPSRM